MFSTEIRKAEPGKTRTQSVRRTKCLFSPASHCGVAAFVVNSEPHTGARPSVRACTGQKTDGRSCATGQQRHPARNCCHRQLDCGVCHQKTRSGITSEPRASGKWSKPDCYRQSICWHYELRPNRKDADQKKLIRKKISMVLFGWSRSFRRIARCLRQANRLHINFLSKLCSLDRHVPFTEKYAPRSSPAARNSKSRDKNGHCEGPHREKPCSVQKI